jgi:hypothetical protein
MPHSRRLFVLVVLLAVSLVPLHARVVSRQHAESFARKLARVQTNEAPAGTTRTLFTEDEVNSWIAYDGQPYLPTGLSDPQLTFAGAGRLTARAILNLDTVAGRRPSGGAFDPLSFLSGRVPVTVTGILHSQDGVGRFDVETAELSGVPVPGALVQELLGQYSRTPDNPQGLRLDDVFPLPSNISRIDTGPGQAVVVQ